MRSAPFNYILSLVVAGAVWVAGSILVGNQLANTVSLETFTTEQFVMIYRIIISCSSVLGWLACAYWFFAGRRDSVAANMPRARRLWNIWFIVEILVSVSAVGAAAAIFSHEALVVTDYLTIFGIAALATWILFWCCSLVMSPRSVKYCVLGRR